MGRISTMRGTLKYIHAFIQQIFTDHLLCAVLVRPLITKNNRISYTMKEQTRTRVAEMHIISGWFSLAESTNSFISGSLAGLLVWSAISLYFHNHLSPVTGRFFYSKESVFNRKKITHYYMILSSSLKEERILCHND